MLAVIIAAAVVAPVDVPFQLPLMLALYTIGAHRSWEATILASAAVVATAVGYAVVGGGPDVGSPDIVAIALLCAVAGGGGLYVGSKRSSITTLEEHAAQLGRERELLGERAVAAERVRIAQELHDVVAHNVSAR